MQLQHAFTVPGSVAATWGAFSDVTSVAECFPGAEVTSAEGDDFEGTCKVKLGPISLVYSGSGRFVLEAKGKDKRGNGTAGANVVVTLASTGTGTKVDVLTDLQITGKPAQFGRGVIQDVSDKLLQQFVTCLETKLATTPDEAVPPPVREESIDLGTTVLPVLAKTYWKQAVGALVILALLIRWLRR